MHLEKVRSRVWVCTAMLLLQACATAGAVGGLEPEEDFPSEEGEVSPLPPWETRGQQEDEDARQAEAAVALAGMRGVASHVDEAGAELAFQFWVQHGALTLLSWKRGGGGSGRAVNHGSFAPGLEAHLPTYVGTRTGEVLFTLRQEQQGWRLHSFSTTDGPKPLEAKTLPVRRTGLTAETLAQAHSVASEMIRGLRIPEGGSASVLVDVRLDDDRVLGATIVRYESQGGPPVRESSPGLVAQTAGPGKIVLGELGGGKSGRTERLRDVLQRAGIAAEVHPDIRAVLWQKFLFICAFSGVTALIRLPIGTVLADPATRALFRGTSEEVEAIARAIGIGLPDDRLDRSLEIAH